MRVLMQIRPDWRELPGGDLVQVQRWAVWLRELGVQVAVGDAAAPALAGVDLVHFYNLGRAYALWPALAHCRRFGVPTVLTPLYWPTEEFERYGRPGLLGLVSRLLPGRLRARLKSAARLLRQPGQRGGLLREVWSGQDVLARRFLAAFDVLIAGSRPEADALRLLLPDHPAVALVHIGVDAFYWSDDRDLWRCERQPAWPGPPADEPDPPEDAGPAPARAGVLCVARFDPQKGQHRLIKALRPVQVPLTLAGPTNPNYPHYRAYCARLGGPSVTILPRQGRGQLRALYRRCRVHALVSWYETTGLTGLEAGCCGARVVMTDRGGTRDYGGELAWYADPADLYSIGRTVEQALEAPDTPDLRTRVAQHFTWEQSARALLRVYQDLLAGRAAHRHAA